MAARVGSVVVDLVANTAQFEAGMKQAAHTTAATDKLITQKAWQAAQSTDKMSRAMHQFERRSMGAAATLEGTTAAMVAHRFGAGGLTRVLFTLDTAYARVKMRADDAARAMAAAGVATTGANSAAMIMTRTLAAMAVKVGVVVGALWAIQKGWDLLSESGKKFDIDETLANAEQSARKLWQVEVGAVDRLQKAIDDYSASWDHVRQAQDRQAGYWDRFWGRGDAWTGRMTVIADVEAELQRAVRQAIDAERREGVMQQAQAASDDARRIVQELRTRSLAAGFDPASGAELTDFERQRLQILRHFESVQERIAQIGHDHLQNRLREITAAQKQVELARVEAAERAQIADAERRAQEERMQHIREQARAMSELFGRAAGLALGGTGADAWRAIQEATRSQQADRAHQHMLEQTGAGFGDTDSRNLRELNASMRELLGEWRRMEAQSI